MFIILLFVWICSNEQQHERMPQNTQSVQGQLFRQPYNVRLISTDSCYNCGHVLKRDQIDSDPPPFILFTSFGSESDLGHRSHSQQSLLIHKSLLGQLTTTSSSLTPAGAHFDRRSLQRLSSHVPTVHSAIGVSLLLDPGFGTASDLFALRRPVLNV